jgi:hypothetical protein
MKTDGKAGSGEVRKSVRIAAAAFLLSALPISKLTPAFRTSSVGDSFRVALHHP